MSLSYRELDIYKVSFDLFIKTHCISLQLPNYELFELGSQLRRSADSVNSNIVEGYGRNQYKKDFIKFLIYSLSSNDETLNHLKKLKILYPALQKELSPLINDYEILGKKINKFIDYVVRNWRS